MKSYKRAVEQTQGRVSYDGAGVKLTRVFGSPSTVHLTDPFLLTDYFGSDRKEDYIRGFPWHPHRGIETVTYLIKGEVEHQDSKGNGGTIREDSVQWMTAGRGIFHQEMPRPSSTTEEVRGFQIWVNLPAERKLVKPKYRNINPGSIPEGLLENGVKIRVISGRAGDIEGPVRDLEVDVEIMDLYMPPETTFLHTVKDGYNTLTYVYEGEVYPDPLSNTRVRNMLSLYSFEGDMLALRSGRSGAKVLVLIGRPLSEPVAWWGPIVMNSREQLETAFRELEEGTFASEADTEDVE